MKRFSPRAIPVHTSAVILPVAAFAQSAEEADPNAAIDKMNAYVSLLNRTIRASESLDRYDSWVDMKKGPTGKERNVYGLYSLYDVRSEIEAAEAAITAEPKLPALDEAMVSYIAIYQKLAPRDREGQQVLRPQGLQVRQICRCQGIPQADRRICAGIYQGAQACRCIAERRKEQGRSGRA
jgi:hypothetical protein